MSSYNSYCPHGGVCVLDLNHEGKHNSKYCQWTDKEAISKEKANELFRLEAAYQDIPNLAEFIIAADRRTEDE